MRIVQISDTHVTHRGGVTPQNFDVVVDFINEQLRPDVVVDTGDVSLLSPDDGADRSLARDLRRRIDAPLLMLPGNHDVGEAGPDPWAGFGVTSERVAAFEAAFGPDHWVELIDGWALVGIDSEILSSGIPEEETQWEWLAGVSAAVGDRPTILFSHKPLWSPALEDPGHAVSLTDAERDRVLGLLADVNLVAAGSGHLHRYYRKEIDGITTVSAPSTAFIVPSPGLGPALEQLGVVEYRCEDSSVSPRFLTTPALDEREPRGIPEMAATFAELGITPTRR